MTTTRLSIAVAVVLAFAAALAGAYLLVLDRPTPESIAPKRQAFIVPSEARTIIEARPANVRVEALPGHEVYAPAWSASLVLQSFVAPGSVLETGAPVALIDGVVRVAAATPLPFYRPLEFGDEGDDVAMLNDLLIALGYLDALPTSPVAYGFTTDAAVTAWASHLGVVDPDGSFDPGWVVWLPVAPLQVARISLYPGAPPPAPGTPLLRGPAEVIAAAVESANPGTTLSFEAEVAYVFVSGEERFSIDTTTAGITPTDLPRLASLLPTDEGQPQISGLVERAEPLKVVAIPATAVQVGPSGELCAWVPVGTRYEARPITVASSRSGVTNVLTGLAAGDDVLANPAAVIERPACPSR